MSTPSTVDDSPGAPCPPSQIGDALWLPALGLYGVLLLGGLWHPLRTFMLIGYFPVLPALASLLAAGLSRTYAHQTALLAASLIQAGTSPFPTWLFHSAAAVPHPNLQFGTLVWHLSLLAMVFLLDRQQDRLAEGNRLPGLPAFTTLFLYCVCCPCLALCIAAFFLPRVSGTSALAEMLRSLWNGPLSLYFLLLMGCQTAALFLDKLRILAAWPAPRPPAAPDSNDGSN